VGEGNNVHDTKIALGQFLYAFSFCVKKLRIFVTNCFKMANDQDAKAYKRYLKNLRDIASEQHTKMADAQDLINKGINKGREEEREAAVIGLHDNGIPVPVIAKSLKITEQKVLEIIETHRNK